MIDVCIEKEVYEKLNGWRRRCENPCPELGYSGVEDMELESPGISWPHNYVGEEALVSLAAVTHTQGTASRAAKSLQELGFPLSWDGTGKHCPQLRQESPSLY